MVWWIVCPAWTARIDDLSSLLQVIDITICYLIHYPGRSRLKDQVTKRVAIWFLWGSGWKVSPKIRLFFTFASWVVWSAITFVGAHVITWRNKFPSVVILVSCPLLEIKWLLATTKNPEPFFVVKHIHILERNDFHCPRDQTIDGMWREQL